MGSSGEASNKSIDSSVGGLVWVRRPNGSWWPGQVLCPEELPESCLVSPRLGTPVKLLGREDLSVDWFNLEKSKRVKAFRCGEYDEWIEKAKASVATSSKKVVKYARREDAILHALELESSRLGKDHPHFFPKMDKKDGEPNDAEKSPNSIHSHDDPEDMEENINSSEGGSDSDSGSGSEPEFSQSGVSFEEPDHIRAAKEQSPQGRRRRTPNDSEDDGTEGSKRMRGLEDLGMGVAVSSVKRKQLPVANVHEFLKRKNRRRPLTKVLESTMMVSVPVMCEELPSPTGSCLPGAFDTNVADSTGISCENGISVNASDHACDASLTKLKQRENEISTVLGYTENGSCDGLFDVPLIAEENHSAVSPSFCSSQKAQIGVGAQSSQSSHVETVSVGNEELNESCSTSSGTADMNTINQRMEKGSSEWQLKGKRNSRNTSKSRKQESISVDVYEEFDAYVAGVDQDVFSLSSGKRLDRNSIGGCLASDSMYRIKSRPVTEIQVDEFRGWGRSQKEPQGKAELPQRLLPYRQSRFTVNPKYDPSDFSLRHHTAESSLYDVNVEVKASYRPHHVPYISLMSKLNGRPIIGHPLTVEVLDDGFCDSLMSSSECYNSSYELDDDLGEDASALQGVDVVYQKKTNSSGRIIPTKSHTFQPHVSPTKSRKNGVLSKKIRKLSSLTGSHKRTDVDKKPVMEKLKGPSVACVPLKVVFSRINAALNGSIRPTNRPLAPTDT